MTKTKYYDLQMDDPQDDYDVEVVNANLKKIDEQMKTRENATDALKYGEVAGGKNLLNPNEFLKWVNKYTTGSYLNDEITISPVNHDLYDNFFKFSDIDIDVTLSIKSLTFNGGSKPRVCLVNSAGTVIGSTATGALQVSGLGCGIKLDWSQIPTSITIKELMVEKGSTATSYEPYTPSVKMLAEENAQQSTEMMDIKMLGWAVPRECPIQNEVNGNQFIQKVGRLDAGSLSWNYAKEFTAFRFASSNKEYLKYGIKQRTILYLYGFNYIGILNRWADIKNANEKSIAGVWAGGDDGFIIKSTAYIDAASFKQAMQGQYLYYELATPITKTIDGNEIGEAVSDIRKETTANLLNSTFDTYTHNGITFTRNDDGTCSLSGSRTDISSGAYITFVNNFPLEKGKYKLTGAVDENNYIRCIIKESASENINVYDYGDGVVLDVNETDTTITLLIVSTDDTSKTRIIKPMLTTNLSATYDDFVPYTGDTGKLNGDVAELKKTVDTLKKSVSDGKTKVANAITGKGVETATDATFDVMAENIGKIDTELHGATLAVRTSDSELFGKTVTLTLNGSNVGTTVFANNGTCSFVVQKPGSYTITCGEAHKDVTVTSDNVLNKTTILVNLLLLKIVTFADGTDEEIAKMIQAHYNNKINIADYWAVGDTRSVSLSAMVPTTVPESHRAQTVQFVIADFEHDTLSSGIGPHSKAAITLLQKDCLMDADTASSRVNGEDNTENGYMRGGSTNEGGWDASARRGWCNDTYFNALPAAWRSMVKRVIKYTGIGGGASSGTGLTIDEIFLPSTIELSGYTNVSVNGEGTQYQYYKNVSTNRYKMPRWSSKQYSFTSVYLTRSPKADNKYEFCYVWEDGGIISQGSGNAAGIAPMLCI